MEAQPTQGPVVSQRLRPARGPAHPELLPSLSLKRAAGRAARSLKRRAALMRQSTVRYVSR